VRPEYIKPFHGHSVNERHSIAWGGAGSPSLRQRRAAQRPPTCVMNSRLHSLAPASKSV
jgi:hypothetical protein